MFTTYFILLAMLVGVNCRNMMIREPINEPYQFEDTLNMARDYEDYMNMEIPNYESVHPRYFSHSRPRRQLQSQTTLSTDGGLNSNFKLPLDGNDKFVVSGLASQGYNLNQGKLSSIGTGLAVDNVSKGYGASLSGRHIPGFGNQVTGAGHADLFKNDNHHVSANAFASRTMPTVPLPNFNTYGGGVDYMFKDKVGGSFTVAQTPLFQKTDYSAMGNLNLFKGRSSSLDMNAGFSKSVSPFIRDQSWQPSAGLIFSKRW